MNHHPVLDPLAMAGVKMGLSRMRDFLGYLGNPHLAAPVVHVAGTNGKGSVTRMVGAMLEAQGYKVGITTSPHLQHINERIRIGSRPIDDATLDALLYRLRDARDAWAADALGPDEPLPLTWFELSIAAAWQHFADERVDVSVVEVGMGGRLDATNVCEPALTAIVTVGLDHTDHLGPDHASIAGEKAGIVKKGVPLVTGPLPHEAMQVIRSVAAERGAPLHAWGADFHAAGTPEDFVFHSPRGERSGLRLALAGDHQVVNAGVALRLTELLPEALAVGEDAMRVGLTKAYNRGRLEWLAPDLLVDGAHNPDGATVLASFLSRLPRDRRRVLLLGGGSDKDVRGVGTALAPHVDVILTTACDHGKARSPFAVARELEGLSVPVQPAGPIAEALAGARNGQDLVIVAGSLFLVGAVRDLCGLP